MRQHFCCPTGGPGPITAATRSADAAAGRTVGVLKDFADKVSLVKRVHCLRVEGGTSHNSGATQVMQVFGLSCHLGKQTDMFDVGSQKYNNGMSASVHDNSHRVDGEYQDNLPRYDKWHMRRFVEILRDLGPSGFNILDNGVAMFHTNIATGNHECSDIPFILAGTAGGRLKPGQYIDANTTNNKLLATVGAALGLKDGGAPITQFGGKKEDGGTVPGGYIDALKGSNFPT